MGYGTVDVVFAWQQLPRAGVSDAEAAVVIDTLRATTTLITAFSRGLVAALPVASVSEARRQARISPGALLGGERRNLPLPGFFGGNSPADYPESKIRGRQLIFTSTNGAAALHRARGAHWVAIGALINATRCAENARDTGLDTVLLCAGTKGRATLEDVLAAGAMVSHWPEAVRSDSAVLAHLYYERYALSIQQGMALSHHARELAAMGFEEDIRWAGQLDAVPLVPLMDVEGWLRIAP